MSINAEQVKNILAIRNDRFGEFLLNIPALRALKETFINSKITVVIDPSIKDLAECVPFVDDIIEWGRQKHTFFEKLSLINLLKRKHIDIAVMLNPSKEFNIFTYLAGIPIRAGYDRKWAFLLTHKIKDKKYLGQQHEVYYNLELVGLVGAKTNDKTPSLIINNRLTNDFKEFNLENQNNLIALHPWTSDPIKQWPMENFRKLAQRLVKEFNKKVILIGGKEELNKSVAYFDNLGANIINMAGKTSLIQLAALLKKCRLLISGDSGPVHLACAVGTPVVAIFRNDIPAKSAKRWGPWGKGHSVIEKPNLADITVDEVLDKARETLR